MSGPLDGVRVLDLSTVLMGPYCTQILAEYGADVVKIEPPGGDGTRHIGPMRSAGMGAIFLHANRGKRSVVLDLKQPRARAALLRLAARADVMVYNQRPQAMDRLGLGYDAVRAASPAIIYAGLFGFGRGGPYARRPAYDDLIQGAVGVPALFQRAGNAEPRYVPITLCDRTVALSAVGAILAALYHRQRSGEGQAIDVPMFETMAGLVMGDHLGGRSFVPPLGATGYARLLAHARRPYQTADGYLCALIYSDKQWQSFCGLIGCPELFTRDERLRDLGTRSRHIDELYGWVADTMHTRTSGAWMELLEQADIPCMPMHTPESLLEDPHLRAIGFFGEIEHPSEGRIVSMAIPSRWSATTPDAPRPAPRLGEHTLAVLAEAGISPESGPGAGTGQP
ncbi:CoA transferase [Algiphilus sp. W345]|uniref:CoA transferase n=1 Tax=Banduia mediterranea TaxID=3075609 RepID=A0ABU2WEU6_9GAMM|nr:CoA transferase [Algiphilus sp. W345]MDT0496386.1 CoA transferase [Algiphilus sp. W345]